MRIRSSKIAIVQQSEKWKLDSAIDGVLLVGVFCGGVEGGAGQAEPNPLSCHVLQFGKENNTVAEKQAF